MLQIRAPQIEMDLISGRKGKFSLGVSLAIRSSP